MRRRSLAILALLGVAVSCSEPTRIANDRHLSPGLGARTYRLGTATVTDIGFPAGFSATTANVYALRENSSGVIAGWASDVGVTHAFRYTPGAGFTDLDAYTPHPGNSFAYDINDAGVIVGSANNGSGLQPIAWQVDNSIINLGTFIFGITNGEATAISSNGIIAGYYQGITDAGIFEYSGGTMTLFTNPPGSSGIPNVTAVNASGALTVNASVGGVTTAFVMTSDGTFTPVGTLGGGTTSQVYDITDAGVFIGCSDGTGFTSHSFSGSAGVPLIDLNAFSGNSDDNSCVRGENVNLDLAGASENGWTLFSIADGFTTVPFPAGMTGTLTDINTTRAAIGYLQQSSGTPNAHSFIVQATGGGTTPSVETPTFAPSQPVKNSAVSLSFTFSDPGGSAAGPFLYGVDWGDGTPAESGHVTDPGTITVSHVYRTTGTFTVGVAVANALNNGASSSTTITVGSTFAPPVAATNGPYTGTEGRAIQMYATGSGSPSGLGVSFLWDFGDGTTSTARWVTTHAYADQGTYTVTLTVTDARGQVATTTTTATVANSAPVIPRNALAVTPGTTVTEGTPVTLTLAGVTDPSSVDQAAGFTYSFDCGDGTGPVSTGSTNSIICPEPDQTGPGRGGLSRTVTASVQDKDGGVSSTTSIVRVVDANPVVSITTADPVVVPANTPFAVDGTFTDAGVNDGPWTYAWGFQEGVTEGSTTPLSGTVTAQGAVPGATHVFHNPGTYHVTLQVTDKDGAVASSNVITVTVTP
jgi:PKD repeat protein